MQRKIRRDEKGWAWRRSRITQLFPSALFGSGFRSLVVGKNWWKRKRERGLKNAFPGDLQSKTKILENAFCLPFHFTNIRFSMLRKVIFARVKCMHNSMSRQVKSFPFFSFPLYENSFENDGPMPKITPWGPEIEWIIIECRRKTGLKFPKRGKNTNFHLGKVVAGHFSSRFIFAERAGHALF